MINQCHIGDCRDTMRDLIAQGVKVQMCVTSPPYWGLRDYGTAKWDGGDAACDHDQRRRENDADSKSATSAGQTRDSVAGRTSCRKCGARRIDHQLGLESTPEAYVAAMVDVFRDVRRVLADDGTLWLNLGSSYASDPAKGGSGTFNGRNGRGESYGRHAIQFRPLANAPAYDSDGKALPDSMAAGSSCPDLCDECLADFLNHCDRIADSDQSTSQSEPPLSQTGRDTEPPDYVSTSLGASPLGVPVSTTLQSWRQHRGACLRCDSRASSLLTLRSSSADVLASSGMSWVNYTSRLKQKDLVPIPWMVAMALQADGWYLRSDIIWAKPNPMPESVTDRCTKAHEYLFLLSKSERYYFDAESIGEPHGSNWQETRKPYQIKDNDDRNDGGQPPQSAKEWRNRRTVWTVPTAPFKGAHFATFPPALVEPCILAGSRPGDVVLDPFFGSGTVGQVCERLGRQWIGCELNEEYGKLAARRTSQMGMTL